MTRYAELPHLASDRSGALWLVFRHWTFAKPNEIYHFYAISLSGGKWSVPVRFSMSSGQNTQHASLTVSPSGELTAGYSADGRSPTVLTTDPMPALTYNIYISNLPQGAGPPGISLADAKLPAPQVRPPLRPRATMEASGRTYHLLMGDAHRHTDIRGHSGVAGPVPETYRYPMAAAQVARL